MIDWSNCPDVELIQVDDSEQWVVVGTRIPADGVIINADDCTPEKLAADLFPGLGIDRAERIIVYARSYAAHFAR
jgi:hypothetical protein